MKYKVIDPKGIQYRPIVNGRELSIDFFKQNKTLTEAEFEKAKISKGAITNLIKNKRLICINEKGEEIKFEIKEDPISFDYDNLTQIQLITIARDKYGLDLSKNDSKTETIKKLKKAINKK